LSEDTYFKKIEIDFTPNFLTIYPKFNDDKCHYTPGFCLASVFDF